MTVFKDNTALILIDIQIDFCPGGALEVGEGNEIVEVANKLKEKFRLKIISLSLGENNFAFSYDQIALPTSLFLK